MENITHSLLGATLAEIALPKDATPRQRTLFYVTGIIAANLPDADLLYTKITPSPLGYLLHHRGHTHTLAGIIVLAALIGIITLLPSLRTLVKSNESRYGVLVFAALGSHLIADSWNSYGVHALWPLTNRWYYGDAIFIAEPWLWALLGVSVVMNTRNDRGRVLLGGALIVIPIGAAFVGLLQMAALIPIAIVVAALAAWMRAQRPPQRAWLSIIAVVVFVGASYTLRNGVRQMTVASNRMGEHRRQIDVILSPAPGNPLCWNAQSLEEAADSLYIRQGSLGIGGSVLRFNPCGRRASAWKTTDVQSIAALRTAMRDDCSVRAWLQFGRAPFMTSDMIADARFGGPGRGNFSAMEVAHDASPRACPPHLTNWGLPRADVLARGR
ncbi:MAG TPA: metal-dependent hydrolase [Gemmatimonadaceae bacterium]|jgi:inner membrane protein